MTSAPTRPRLFAVAVVTCALGATCGSTPSEPHGSPILTSVYWSAGGEQFLVWSVDNQDHPTSPVPPFVSEIDFVFDRFLDGSRIEDLVTIGGVVTAVPKATPSIRASWDDMATIDSVPPVELVIDYNTAPRFGAGSSYVFARPQVPGFPALARISFQLDTTLLTSNYGEPATVVRPVTASTSAFSGSIAVGTSMFSSGAQIPLSFSNRLPAVAPTSPFVHVTTAGAPVPYKLLADASLASRWYLAPADCLPGWPLSATFAVTIDAGFVDAFGDKLEKAVTATFSTGPGAGPGRDGSCSIGDAGEPADGGVADSGDGGVD